MMPFHGRPWGSKWSRELQFPTRVTIECEFEPLQAFGGPAPPGRTVGLQHQRFVWNARSGRQFVISDPPLPPITVRHQQRGRVLEAHGHHFVVTMQCQGSSEVEEWAWRLRTLLPLALSIEFADPATVSAIRGSAGEASFTQRLAHCTSEFEVVTQEAREERAVLAWNRIGLLDSPANRGLAMALQHFHAACRLQRCGASPWEFMGETLLNYAKALESLFPNTGAMEEGLRRLGLAQLEVDTWFKPLREIRNTFNVGHTSQWVVPAEHLATLHEYTDHLEGHFRRMLQTVVRAVERGTFAMPTDEPNRRQRERHRHRIKLLESLADQLAAEKLATDDTASPA